MVGDGDGYPLSTTENYGHGNPRRQTLGMYWNDNYSFEESSTPMLHAAQIWNYSFEKIYHT